MNRATAGLGKSSRDVAARKGNDGLSVLFNGTFTLQTRQKKLRDTSSMELRAAVCSALSDWQSSTLFPDVYLFGSLVHKNGRYFDIHRSDVDVVCVFPESADFVSRAQVVHMAQDATVRVNAALLRIFGRSDASAPLVSIVPVSKTELRAGLHKGGVDDFFEANQFIVVGTQEPVRIPRVRSESSNPIEAAVGAIRQAQGVRNAALKYSANGSGGLANYAGYDPLPKDLLRAAAQVRFALAWEKEEEPEPEQRTDLVEGLHYMNYLVQARRSEAPVCEDLYEAVGARLLRRGGPHELRTIDQLLLWEILAEDAYDFLRNTPVSYEMVRRVTHRVTPALRSFVMARDVNICRYPGCGIDLTGIGEVAAIHALSETGPRHDANLEAAVFHPENLLALCPTHHRMIDRNPEDYPAHYLRTWQGRSDEMRNPGSVAVIDKAPDG